MKQGILILIEHETAFSATINKWFTEQS